MKSYCITIVSVLYSLILFAQENIDGYVTVFEDHFNEFDENKWDKIFPWYNYENPFIKSYYRYDPSSQNHIISNGNLELIAREEKFWGLMYNWNQIPPEYYKLFDYTSGMIYSKRKFVGGYFMIDCLIPDNNSLTSAFWLYGICDQELDVFEIWEKGPIHQLTNYHYCGVECIQNACENKKQLPFYIKHSAPLSSKNHRFGLSWDLNNKIIAYSVDGNLVRLLDHLCFNSLGQEAPCTSPGIVSSFFPNKKMNIIANLAVINKPGNIQIKNNILGKLKINYIKALYPIDCSETKTVCNLCSNDIYEICPSTITGKFIQLGGCTSSEFILEAVDEHGERNYLDVFATEKIILANGFKAAQGSYFKAQIVPCPNNSDEIVYDYKSTNSQEISEIQSMIDWEPTLAPNPVKQGTAVRIMSSEYITSLLYDSLNREILSLTENNVIETSALKPGIYFVKITSGKKMVIKKLIVN